MMIKTTLISLILSIVYLVSNAQSIDNVNIYGKISNSDSGTVYLSVLANGGMIKVDSCIIREDNSFSLSTNAVAANFYQLNLSDNQSSILVIEPNENVNIELSALEMMNPSKINGSKNSEEIYSMMKIINQYTSQLQALEAVYQQYYGTEKQDSIQRDLVPKYESIDAQRKGFIRQSIFNNPTLGNILFIEQISIDDDFELYKKVDEVLYKLYPQNPYIADLHNKVREKLKISVGQMAPEISLQSPEGEVIKLSSLRGKVVLIDFWAAWCRPCRAENPNMVRIYNAYKDKGFDIYGVSLDKTKSDWVKAITDDGLIWNQVSDLRYWNSTAAKEYGVGSIPFTVLVGKDGKILATGLRGESLERKLQELLGN